MRIIGQDKDVDVPYELVTVAIIGSSVIHAYMSERGFYLGAYSTENKAKAVLMDIVTKYKEKAEYYEMPSDDKVLTHEEE